MPNYKDQAGALHFLESVEFEHLLPPGCEEISAEEAKRISAEMSKPTPEQEQEANNARARAYLASTDWYVIRMQETGELIPENVLAERAAARASVV